MTMRFHTKLLGMAVFAGLLVAMGSQGQAAPANGQCAKLYRGVYTHSALHKAFATLDGARPSPRTVCGYGNGFKLKSQAVARALRECTIRRKKFELSKPCRIIAIK